MAIALRRLLVVQVLMLWQGGFLFDALPDANHTGAIAWPGKTTVTFTTVLCAARRWLWTDAILPRAGEDMALDKLPERGRELLLTTLAPAA